MCKRAVEIYLKSVSEAIPFPIGRDAIPGGPMLYRAKKKDREGEEAI
jgi:hypothetical protein